VTAPDGRHWNVSRHIRWPRMRKIGDFDLPDAFVWLDGGDTVIGGIVITIAVAVLVAFLIVLLLPVVILVVEAIFVVVATIALRRTWVVSARTAGPPPEVRSWRVRGPLRSWRAVREVADELRRGVTAEPSIAEPA
jgi:hypothetical protein